MGNGEVTFPMRSRIPPLLAIRYSDTSGVTTLVAVLWLLQAATKRAIAQAVVQLNRFLSINVPMRRDSIFYALFQRSPSLRFELLEKPPAAAAQYRFESVVVKEPKFEIDGVFLPPASEMAGTVFFAEVQMQKDEQLYERINSSLYFISTFSNAEDLMKRLAIAFTSMGFGHRFSHYFG